LVAAVAHDRQDSQVLSVIQPLRQFDGKADEGALEKSAGDTDGPVVDLCGLRFLAGRRRWRSGLCGTRRGRQQQRRHNTSPQGQGYTHRWFPCCVRSKASRIEKTLVVKVLRCFQLHSDCRVSRTSRSGATAEPRLFAASYHRRASAMSGVTPPLAPNLSSRKGSKVSASAKAAPASPASAAGRSITRAAPIFPFALTSSPRRTITAICAASSGCGDGADAGSDEGGTWTGTVGL